MQDNGVMLIILKSFDLIVFLDFCEFSQTDACLPKNGKSSAADQDNNKQNTKENPRGR